MILAGFSQELNELNLPNFKLVSVCASVYAKWYDALESIYMI